ncbi:MAG: heavy-metal-associated domain-containing protein [Candidatus Izemoplasmatales bacterium]
MKTIFIKGICCKGCAKELEGIFKKIYGISDVKVSVENCTVTYEGYVSKRVIQEALEGTKYEIENIVSK